MRFAVPSVIFGLAAATAAEFPRAKNFIYVVPDGYGVASQVLARDFSALANKFGTAPRPDSPALGADPLVIGTVRTQSSDSLVTDSASSATAFACGVKTYNGAIGVDDNGIPVASILEAAHLSGLRTGLVVTTRVSHATPACYAAHVLERASENDIAAQEIGYSHPLGSVVDLLLGGGRRHFLPISQGGKRSDNVNLIDWAVEKGWRYVSTKRELDMSTDDDGALPLPFLGLFSPSHMAFELDRDRAEQPSLLEMAKTALDTLEKATRNSEKGYFIMIEASRIDHAGHANDAVAHIHDTLMFNSVLAYIKQYIDSHPDTHLLSAADHECGGLTLEDGYNPTALQGANHTFEYLGQLFGDYRGDKGSYLKDKLLPMYGLLDVSSDNIEALVKIARDRGVGALGVAAGNLLASEAGLHWSTEGHTAADVVLYGYANKDALRAMKDLIGRNINNNDIPLYIEEVLGLSLADTTRALRKDGVDWVGRRDELHLIKRAGKARARGHDH